MSAASAQNSTDETLAKALKKHQMLCKFTQGQLQGKGAEFLIKKGSEAQFFLIGEAPHGVAEYPVFAKKMFEKLTQYGYRYAALEAGPITANLLTSAHKNSPNAVEQLHKAYPFSIPFFSLTEESNYIGSVVKHSKATLPLWGLDQEFMTSSRLLLNELVKVAPNAQAKKLAKTYVQKAQQGYDRMLQTKKPVVFMSTAKADDFVQLKKAFDSNKQGRAQQIIQELEDSWNIYHLYNQGQNYLSNDTRGKLMQKHFMQYYRQAVAGGDLLPKVIFKFGAYHMYKGITPTNILDIGTFVHNLATMNQTRSFHVLVVGKKGFLNSYFPFTSKKAQKMPYDAYKMRALKFVTPILDAAVDTQQWTVIDLQAVKLSLDNRKINKLNKKMKDLILGFDAIVVIPEVKAASNFQFQR